jgi:hypothetical protein
VAVEQGKERCQLIQTVSVVLSQWDYASIIATVVSAIAMPVLSWLLYCAYKRTNSLSDRQNKLQERQNDLQREFYDWQKQEYDPEIEFAELFLSKEASPEGFCVTGYFFNPGQVEIELLRIRTVLVLNGDPDKGDDKDYTGLSHAQKVIEAKKGLKIKAGLISGREPWPKWVHLEIHYIAGGKPKSKAAELQVTEAFDKKKRLLVDQNEIEEAKHRIFGKPEKS